MPALVKFGYGFRRLVDSNQRYMLTQPGPVYLRLRNFADLQNQAWAQFGFSIAPTGADVGVQDVEIDPPPAVNMISQHTIGMSGGKLRFGAKEFLISHTFVLAQMKRMNLLDPTLVWRGPLTVGLVHLDKIFDIVQYPFEALAGEIITWLIQANGSEVR